MKLKSSTHIFLVKHQGFIVKTFAWAGSMLGTYLGQMLGQRALAASINKTQPKPPKHQQGRTLITETGRYPMVIVYHEADKAGPHIDVHIGQMSLIYRVRPELKEQLVFTREGYLNKKSKKLILDHLRSEIDRRAKVPQNLDHSFEQAIFGWVDGGSEQNGYGAGKTRQVVDISLVDVLKTENAIEFFAPKLNPHRALYVYRLFPGSDTKAPILIWGNKTSNPPMFQDRLHLKSLNPDHINMDKLEGRVDWSTSTAKYDGSSTYLVIGPSGTTAWSPRLAKSTGERIEYTHKLMNLSELTSDETIIAMGEILYTDEYGSYLKGAKISGILNSNEVLPDDIYPEIRLYRVDQIGDNDTFDLPFWENRQIQEYVSSGCPDILKPAELMTPHQAKKAGMEGVVVAPPEKSVIDGYKIKWWRDPNDWKIDEVKLRPGEKGRIAGVVACTSLDSGKQFNLGATAIGNEYQTKHMMENPDLYKGTVLKVVSRHGHEGRSAKVVGFHDDKGLAAV